MQLASKESDIEQLRAKLLDLSDSTSVASFPSADETDGNLPGKNIPVHSGLIKDMEINVCFFHLTFYPLSFFSMDLKIFLFLIAKV